MSRASDLARRAALPTFIFAVSGAVYGTLLGTLGVDPVDEDHYVHLAHAWLEGQLHLVGNRPHGTNDWACFDTELEGMCPQGVFQFPERDGDRYLWYVSFPPLPALVVLPFVAAFGTDIPGGVLFAIFGGLAPALLYVLLRYLREAGISGRTPRDDVLLTVLFAFGTVYFSTATQGTVWYAAHVVASSLIAAFVLFGIGARKPVLAGFMLGLCFLTRPTTLFLGAFFVVEALRASRRAGAMETDASALVWRKISVFLAGVDYVAFARRLGLFALPILASGVVAMVYNEARFGSPFEFGHTFLQIKWRPRIERWGLFNYHYMAKNLAVFLASLPWLSSTEPFLKISRHGLALWVTTPQLVLAAYPKVVRTLTVALYAGVVPVLLLNLMYQNSGWIQFGYRFALDYMVLLFVVLAIGGRRLGPGFLVLTVLAIAINTFGAVTFSRAWQYYDGDATQNVLFQPD